MSGIAECGQSGDLHQSHAQAADEIVFQELAGAPLRLDGHAEHPEHEHVEEQVQEAPVHEHVGHGLPDPALLQDLLRHQAEMSTEGGPHDGADHEHRHIGQHEVLDPRGHAPKAHGLVREEARHILSASMSCQFEPALTSATRGTLSLRRFLHSLLGPGGETAGLRTGDFEEELVMDLQEHAGLPLPRQPAVRRDHGELDDVRGASLDGGVARGALGELPQGRVLGVELRQMPDPAEESAHAAVPARGLQVLGHPGRDPGIARQVVLDVASGLALRYAQLRGQAEGGLPVDDAEIDGLGAAAHLLVDICGRHMEDLAGRAQVDVLVLAEGLGKGLVARDVGQHAQVDLRVVGGDQHAALTGHEGAAYPLPGRGTRPGCSAGWGRGWRAGPWPCAGLVEMGVHPASPWGPGEPGVRRCRCS